MIDCCSAALAERREIKRPVNPAVRKDYASVEPSINSLQLNAKSMKSFTTLQLREHLR
jgi:hypothetical protein